ncbi:SRPBCC family protein [Geodermatophilus sp. URMC 64]
MQTLDHDSVSIVVDAAPEVVYDLVADVTRTPEFSPEIDRCTWLDGATGPATGARFEAVNRTPNARFRFRNRPRVVVADRGREFAFARTEPFGGTLTWRYRFEPEGTGTRVTESYEVPRPVSRIGWLIIERLGGSTDRRAELRRGMETTLRRLREAAEREPVAS